jgi:hypothetical protein
MNYKSTKDFPLWPIILVKKTFFFQIKSVERNSHLLLLLFFPPTPGKHLTSAPGKLDALPGRIDNRSKFWYNNILCRKSLNYPRAGLTIVQNFAIIIIKSQVFKLNVIGAGGQVG